MLPREKKLLALFVSSTATLLVACAWLIATRTPAAAVNTQAALADIGLRDKVVRQLTSTTTGIWDTHNDPEVGRVIQPNLQGRVAHGKPIDTNAFGLREEPIALPKPPGTLRIVLLGDSYVHGYGVEADERLGSFLQRALAQRAPGFTGTIECLHVGVGGWNIIAECAYLRRMLSALAPDLVFHVLIGNDLDDHAATRGFGAFAAHSADQRARTDALVNLVFPTQYSQPGNTNYLLWDADFESRQRYQAAAAAIERLVLPLRAAGAKYVAISNLAGNSGRLWRYLEPVLAPEEFVVLPPRLLKDTDLILSPQDQHWSRAGHELVARILFALVRANGLLPTLTLEPWPEIEELALSELAEARNAALKRPPAEGTPPPDTLSALEPARFDERAWRQVYTGLDDQAQVSPFASFFLLRHDHQSLRLRGRALARPELAGARVRVSIEGLPVGEHELVPGQAFDVRFPVPAEIAARRGVNVRLETSDYGYAGPYQQHCISFVLDELALE